MVFRRPRVNVKPNVQSIRPANSAVRPSETSAESMPPPSLSVDDDQTAQPVEISNEETPTVIDSQDTQSVQPPPTLSVPDVESTTDVEETIKTLSPSPIDPPPLPSTTTVSSPVQDSFPTTVSSSPASTTTSLPIRLLGRRKVIPRIAGKAVIPHRRPSASCSGTESETELSRQKHSTTTSSISYTRVMQPPVKSTILTELPSALPSDTTIIETATELSTTVPTGVEVTFTDQSESISSPIENPIKSDRALTNSRISREDLTQHINYRAQRLASKVEPDKTIRKRRAATLGKIDRANANRDGPIDTSKLTIADFVHYNPVDNPMEPKVKSSTQVVNDAALDPVRKQSISSCDAPVANLAPQLKIDANGMLIIDEESLYIRNTDDTQRQTVVVEGQFNDDNLTHKSYRKIGQRKRWSNRDTLRFYQALRMCGTDFSLISNVFPNRDRNDIKRKFKTEDKANRTLVDSALSQRIPFDATCFYSPSEDSSDEDDGSDSAGRSQKKSRKRRKLRTRQTSSSDPLEINRRREKRLQAKKNSTRVKKSAEYIDDDDDDENDDEHSMDVADTVEVVTTPCQSKNEQRIPLSQDESNSPDTSLNNIAELENILGRIDGGHLLFVHNTDETTGLDRIDVHVVTSNGTENINEQSI